MRYFTATILLIQTLLSATFYVDGQNGDDNNTGANPYSIEIGNDGPFATIQAGVNAAASDTDADVDIIIVYPGQYVENLSIQDHDDELILTTMFTYTAENPYSLINDTVIDGNQAGSVISIEDCFHVLIRGFTITNGSGQYIGYYNPSLLGGGIFCDGSYLTLVNSNISGNILDRGPNNAARGAGIYINSSDLSVYNCLISENSINIDAGNNSEMSGVGICFRNYGDMIIENSVISGNTTNSANARGLGISHEWGENLVIRNSTFTSNIATNIGQYTSAIYFLNGDYEEFEMTNSLFHSNSGEDFYNTFDDPPNDYLIEIGSTGLDIHNNIIGQNPAFLPGTPVVYMGYAPGTGSPCIDAGYIPGDGNAFYSDYCFPPSLGSSVSDIGAYGGYFACSSGLAWGCAESIAVNTAEYALIDIPEMCEFAPYIEDIPDTRMNTDDTISIDFIVSDEDNEYEDLTILFESECEFFTSHIFEYNEYDETTTLTLFSDASYSDECTCTITAYDPQNNSAVATFEIIVNDLPVFDPNEIETQNVLVGTSFTFPETGTFTYSDPNNDDTVVFSYTGAPNWITVTDDNGEITIESNQNPSMSDLGEHTILLELDDGHETNVLPFTVNVYYVISIPTNYPSIQNALDSQDVYDGAWIILEDCMGEVEECGIADTNYHFQAFNLSGRNVTIGSMYLIDGDEEHIDDVYIDGDNASSVITYE